jgi:hypothetical protein
MQVSLPAENIQPDNYLGIPLRGRALHTGQAFNASTAATRMFGQYMHTSPCSTASRSSSSLNETPSYSLTGQRTRDGRYIALCLLLRLH